MKIYILLIVALFLYLCKNKKKSIVNKTTFHASKCFSCEKQTPTYLSQKTKCFSCEKDLIRRKLSPSLGQPVKCFDCL